MQFILGLPTSLDPRLTDPAPCGEKVVQAALLGYTQTTPLFDPTSPASQSHPPATPPHCSVHSTGDNDCRDHPASSSAGPPRHRSLHGDRDGRERPPPV